MRLRGDYELDLSFQRGCGQNIETTGVICCLHLFSLGYRSRLVTTGWGVKGKSQLGRVGRVSESKDFESTGVSAPQRLRSKGGTVGHTDYLGHPPLRYKHLSYGLPEALPF